MIKPVQKAPKEFAERYNRIVDGEEVIDTVTKLKEFWLFAIEQGQEHREMREYIASFACGVPTSKLVHAMIFSDSIIKEAYIQLETFVSVGDSPHPDKTDEQYHDELWNRLKVWYIDDIQAKKLDDKLALLEKIPQLNEDQVQKFLAEFKFSKKE